MPSDADETLLLSTARNALQRVRDSYIRELTGVAAVYDCTLPAVAPELFPETAEQHLPERLKDVLVPLLQTLALLNGQLASYSALVDAYENEQEDESEDEQEETASTSPSSDAEVIHWQPVSFLPQIQVMIDGMRESAEENWRTLQPVRERPHILDDHTVGRLFEVYGSQQEDLWLYRAQLAEWMKEQPTPEQTAEITRLDRQLDKLATVLERLLALADEVQDKTIDKLFGKDDAEVGLEFLFGKYKL